MSHVTWIPFYLQTSGQANEWALESGMPKLEPWLPHVLAVTSGRLLNL